MVYYRTAIVSVLLLWSLFAVAQSDKITVQEAHQLSQKGDIVLVDIRSEPEWQKTGVAPQAITLTMHQEGGLPEFSQKLQQLLNDHPNKPVALICAGGVRSNKAQAFLKQQGIITNVLDVKEGMVGGFFTKGWIDQKLPITQYLPK